MPSAFGTINQDKKMPKASELKKGSVVEIDGEVYFARNIDVRNPSARGASTLYKIKFFNVRDGKKLEQTLKSDDFVKEGDLTRRSVQFSYREGDMVTFMDAEDYSQYTLNAEALAEQSPYMTEDLQGMIAMLVDGQVVGVEIPQAVVLEITQTDPGIKTASVSARTKPATLSTGLEIQVPEYMESGERVKVNTSTGKYVSRA
jgi:elongation factor P